MLKPFIQINKFKQNVFFYCFLRLNLSFSFTFMHLADAFIQSDLQCIQAIHVFYQYVCSLGIEPMTFGTANAMLYHWATGTLKDKFSSASWCKIMHAIIIKSDCYNMYLSNYFLKHTHTHIISIIKKPLSSSHGLKSRCHLAVSDWLFWSSPLITVHAILKNNKKENWIWQRDNNILR